MVEPVYPRGQDLNKGVPLPGLGRIDILVRQDLRVFEASGPFGR